MIHEELHTKPLTHTEIPKHIMQTNIQPNVITREREREITLEQEDSRLLMERLEMIGDNRRSSTFDHVTTWPAFHRSHLSLIPSI